MTTRVGRSTLYMLNTACPRRRCSDRRFRQRRGSRSIADYGGVQKVAPILAGTFMVSAMATVSLPGLAPFISEFWFCTKRLSRYWLAAAFGVTALVRRPFTCCGSTSG